MMPRFVCFLAVIAVIACGGCVADHRIVTKHGLAGEVSAQPHVRPPRGPVGATHQQEAVTEKTAAKRPNIQLTALQAVVCQGEQFDGNLIEQSDREPELQELTPDLAPSNPIANPIEPLPLAEEPLEATLSGADVVQINLPSALAMIGGRHPAVGFAQWRVKEAYAKLQQARVLWLPSIHAGMSYDRHDGNYQASDGSIIDVNRNSLQYGLGMGATGAGTTPFPGIVTKFHLADAVFQPKIAQQRAWSQTHAVGAALNRQLMETAVAYIQLTGAHQAKSVLEQSQQRITELAKLTHDFAQAGQGLQADADRMQTELKLIDSQVVAASERVAVASAHLAQTLNTDPTSQLVPLDPTIVPLDMSTPAPGKTTLITTGLSNRPELKQARSLVAAACDAYKREQYAPLIPSVLLGFTTGGFGGGLSANTDDFASRYDFDAIVSWELRNLGFGDQASRRESHARIQQAKFEKIRLMDQIAREIAEADAQVNHRRQQVAITRQAIESAENSYARNVNRIRDGQGLPLEVLQSATALEDARMAYLNAVVDYNVAQFRLQWALGWPITAGLATGG